MAGLNDLYVLASERTLKCVERFLHEVLPNRIPTAAEYGISEESSARPLAAGKAEQLIEHCVNFRQAQQAIYFENCEPGPPSHAMLFFTGDGHLILGISMPADYADEGSQSQDVASWLLHLARVTGALEGYALWESHPSFESREAFLSDRNLVTGPKLIAGKIVLPEDPSEGITLLQ